MGACRYLFAFLIPTQQTTDWVLLLLVHPALRSTHSQGASWPVPEEKRAQSTEGLCWRGSPLLSSVHTQTASPPQLSLQLPRGAVSATVLCCYLGQVMKDISQKPLYSSSCKYLLFLGPRCLLVTDTFLGSRPCCGQVRMYLLVNAKNLPAGHEKRQKHSSYQTTWNYHTPKNHILQEESLLDIIFTKRRGNFYPPNMELSPKHFIHVC